MVYCTISIGKQGFSANQTPSSCRHHHIPMGNISALQNPGIPPMGLMWSDGLVRYGSTIPYTVPYYGKVYGMVCGV